MMVKNKVYALALTLVIAFQCIGISTVFALNSWDIEYIGDYKTDRNTYYAEKSASGSLNGSTSMRVVYPNGEEEGTYLKIKNTLASNPESGEYTLTVNYKGRFTKANLFFGVGDTEISFADENWSAAENVTGDSGASGWKQIKITFSYTEKENAEFYIKATGNITGVFLDDLSLVKSGTEDNLISDSSFESEDEQEQPDTPDIPDTPDNPVIPPEETEQGNILSEYAPQRFVINSRDDKVTMSWYNPTKGILKKISLFELSDGEEILIKDDFSIAGGKYVDYESDVLIPESLHTYKIVLEYTNHDTVEYFAYVTVKTDFRHMNTTLGTSWSRIGNVRVENVYDTNVKHSGKASMKFTSNIQGYEGEVYGCFRNSSVSFAADKEYEISFYLKANDLSQFLVEMNWDPDVFTPSGEMKEPLTKNMGGAYEWTKFTLRRKPGKAVAGPLMFLLNTGCDFWIDDITVCEVLSDGTFGDNILTDGDFEYIEDTTVLSELEDLTSKGYNTDVSFSWKVPERDCERVHIYQKEGDKWSSRGYVSASQAGVTFNRFTADEEYTFKVCPVNSYNLEGEGSIVTVKTELPDFLIDEVKITNQQNQTPSSITAGIYKVSSTVKNYKVSGGLDIEMFVGVYQGDALVKLYSEAKKFELEDKVLPAVPISISEIKVPNDGKEYKIKVFWLDSRNIRNVLTESTEF